jgi:hypothetical protein
MRTSTFRTAVIVALVVAGITSTAYAQQGPAPGPGAAPLTVERVENGFVVAPDFKVTDIGDELGQLAGVYAGSILDERVLVGAALYWLANGSDNFKLTYGGLLVGWTTPDSGRIRFGVRGLAGVATATLPVEAGTPFVRVPLPGQTVRFGSRTAPRGLPDAPLPQIFRFGVSDEFLVFEPMGTFVLNVTSHISITVGAGYRAVALTDALRDRVDGPTGSIGLELDW